MADEAMEFTIRAGQAMAELRNLQQEHAALGRVANSSMKDAAKGHQEAEKAAVSYFGKMAQLEIKMKQMRKEVEQYKEQMEGGSTRTVNMAMATQQLAYAADDAAISFGTGGWSGAIRGAANNLSALAMMIDPVKGALVGIGLAVGSVAAKNLLDGADAMADYTRSLEHGTASALDFKKTIDDLDLSILKLKGDEESAAKSRAIQRRVDVLSKPKAEWMKASQIVSDAKEEMQAARDVINNPNMPEQAKIPFRARLATLSEALPGQEMDEARALRNLQAIDRGLLDEEKAGDDARAKDKRDKFIKDFRKRSADFGGDFMKAWNKRSEKFDPLSRKIDDAKIEAEHAQRRFDEEQTRAQGPSRRGQYRDDIEDFKISDNEQKKLAELRYAAEALRDVAKTLETQKHVRDRDKLVNRQPGG